MDSITLVLALGNLALCAALFFFDHEARRSSALAHFALARQCQAGAWILLALGSAGVLPEPLGLPLGYALLFAGVAVESGAFWEARGHARWRRPTLALLALAVLVFLGCYLVDAVGLRAVAVSLVIGGFYLSGALALGRGWRGASLLQRFLAVAGALLALAVAARGVMVMAMPEGWGWLSNGLLRQVSIAAYYLLMLLNAFGMLLLGREKLQHELARLQLVDPLTEVPNRRGFFNLLAPWMALARRPGQPTALVTLDLDQFKRVNDGYGHAAGDVVLRHVADICKRQLRDSDQLGRLVGGEFAILLPRTGADEARLVAERMRAAVEANPVKTERALIAMTASFGVTTILADDSTVTLFQRAHEALRVAKAAGRNRVEQASAARVVEDA
jgi:diguanylate cyclase (GGDEF)-like protein